MTFDVSGTSYNDADDCLDEVVRLINTGTTRNGEISDIEERTKLAIEKLKNTGKARRFADERIGALKLEIAEATFLYQSGNPAGAAKLLETRWNGLKPRLYDGSFIAAKRAPQSDHRMREKEVSACMHYVFYALYYCAAEYKDAINEFQVIRECIDKGLVDANHPCHTTLALFNYFLGHCLRAQRKFRAAEEHFLKAQRHTLERLAEKRTAYLRDAKQIDLAYELAHNAVFTARVIGNGISWVALHEGRLLKAAQLITTAQTLIACTGLQSLKNFMEAKFHTIQRRRAQFGTEEYREALKGLEDCAQRFKHARDRMGELRCARELVRGYLDLAEFVEEDKAQNIDVAGQWLKRLEELRSERGAIRHLLLRARYLFVVGDLAGAVREYRLADGIATKSAGSDDKAAESQIDLDNMGALLQTAQGDFDGALTAVELTLRMGRSRPAKSIKDRHIDPVLEGECYLLAMDAAISAYRFEASREYLRRWELLSHFVENVYLRSLASRCIAQLKAPFPFIRDATISFETKNYKAHVAEFEAWLQDVLDKQYPGRSKKQKDQAMGVSGTTRWRKERKSKPLRANAPVSLRRSRVDPSS